MRWWWLNERERNLDEAVRASAKVATELTAIPVKTVEPPAITATKFGGTPYAEADDVWPMLDARPYDFVAQLNLRDSFAPPATPYDLITIFISWMVIEDHDQIDFERLMDRVCVVRTYSDPSEAKAVAMPRPQPVRPNDFQVIPCAAEARRVLSYPSGCGGVPSFAEIASRPPNPRPRGFAQMLKWMIGVLFEPLFGRDLHDMYRDSLKRILGWDWKQEQSRIGGYPTLVHYDPFGDDEDLFFLAQITHEPTANFCLYDAAPLLIAAHHSDPTRFEFDPWQSH